MAKKAKYKNSNSHDELKWPYGRKNYIVFGIAMAVITAGFLALWKGDITFAPVLLVVGYCVLLPISLWIKGTDEDLPDTEPDGQ